MPIDEIIVTAPAPSAPTLGGAPRGRTFSFSSFDQDGGCQPSLTAFSERMRKKKEKEKQKAIDEIVVTASAFVPIEKRGQLFPAERRAVARVAERVAPVVDDILKPKPFFPVVPFEEITVIGKRPSKLRIASRFASRLAVPFAVAEASGELLAAIIRQLSRQALDEAGRIATQPTRFRPDSPVRTMQTPEIADVPSQIVQANAFPEQQTQEIVVTARRPRSLQFQEPALSREQIAMFNADMLRNSMQLSVAESETATETQTQTATSTRRSTLLGVGQLTDSLLAALAETGTALSSQVQNLLATRTRTGTDTRTGTRAQTQSQLRITNPVGQRTRYCEPEPEQPRKKCYKKMVKEKTLPSNDIENRWIEINCETGKEIPPKKRGN